MFLPKTELQSTYLTEAKSEAITESNSKITEIIPQKKSDFQIPQEITARSAVIVDAKTGSVLFTKNPDLKHLPASTTKLMTALVALEKCDPDKIITVGKVEQEGSKMGLAEGDQVSVENLLYGIIVSGCFRNKDFQCAFCFTCFNSI